MSLPTVSTETIERGPAEQSDPPVVLRAPRLGDGAAVWRIARDSQVLDTNSSYSYLLWCRDFAGTSVVAEIGDRVVGFVTGYLRPEAPDTVFVWQVAVDRAEQGRGIGVNLLAQLLENVAVHGVCALETTVSPDNTASIAMFTALARRVGAPIERSSLFDPEVFPDSHEAEDLYRIAPIAPTTERDR